MTSCSNNQCGCNNTPTVGNTQINLMQVLADGAGGCGARWVQLGGTTFIPQDFGSTQTVGVPCGSSGNFPVGTCVLLLDEAGNRQVQQVASHPDADNLSLLAYDNDFSDETTQLSGVIMMFALPLCPLARTESSCSDGVLVSTQAFTMPSPVDDPDNPGASVQVCFDRAMRLTVGTILYVDGAGFMQVGAPPTGDFVQCSQCFYLYNSGATGNAATGATIGAGKTAYPAQYYTLPLDDITDLVNSLIPSMKYGSQESIPEGDVLAAGATTPGNVLDWTNPNTKFAAAQGHFISVAAETAIDLFDYMLMEMRLISGPGSAITVSKVGGASDMNYMMMSSFIPPGYEVRITAVSAANLRGGSNVDITYMGLAAG